MRFMDRTKSGQNWRYGDADHLNLGGTTRTLDGAVGAVELDPDWFTIWMGTGG